MKRKRRKNINYAIKKKRNVDDDNENENRIYPRLVNSVIVIDLGDESDLDVSCLSQISNFFELLRFKFAAKTMRILIPPDNPKVSKKTTGLVYETGRFILVGSTSKEHASTMCSIYMNELGKIRRRVYIRDKNGKITGIKHVRLARTMKIVKKKTSNTVYKTDFNPDDIHLDEIWRENSEFTQFSREAFQGPRIHGKNATFLIFQKGCCLVLGLCGEDKLDDAYKEICGYVDSSKKLKSFMDSFNEYLDEEKNKQKTDDENEMNFFITKEEFGKTEARKKLMSKLSEKHRFNVDMSDFIQKYTDLF